MVTGYAYLLEQSPSLDHVYHKYFQINHVSKIKNVRKIFRKIFFEDFSKGQRRVKPLLLLNTASSDFQDYAANDLAWFISIHPKSKKVQIFSLCTEQRLDRFPQAHYGC